ncbi:MAG: gliding motility-associated C-terminal domain-containing protein [Flavobacteriales bacterium]|nr:gliding motility-associated C-terminal domain-containing protein [Flavobacteriales bacterium]
MKKIIATLLVGWGAVLGLNAQENGISNTTLTTCQGFLVDTGLSAADYGNNEDITMTICPEAGETYLNLAWNFFNVGAGDFLTIYDGDSDAAPVIGTYSGTDLQQVDITSSDLNPTGCLTLHWTSDGSDVGSFGAEISCGLPCIRPVVAVDFEGEIPLRVCPGDEITMDASPTVFADGQTIESWTWQFADGTTNTTDWPVVTHSFDTPGAYKMQLFVTDDNECSSNNLIDVLVYVSNDPIIELSGGPSMCLGAELDITGTATPVTWTAIPDGIEGGELFIPDDQSECFSSEITYNIFPPGEEIDDINDLESFYINFEHSYMGDLVITFICPNGQSITVHQQGGGSTFLGEPVDDDFTPLVSGVGYDYWWSPDATNGTWADESAGFSTLPSGVYDSVDPWTNLIGCPLNGTWEIEVCDMWGSDNGFIFNWTVEMDPSLYPENLTFTPSIGTDCDSTYWSGPNITGTSADCSTITIMPTEGGSYDYVFTALNNHGCTFEETYTINVVDIDADAGPDVTFCGDDLFLDGSAITQAPFNNITYAWTPEMGLEGYNISDPQVLDVTQSQTYTLTVFPVGFPECADTDEVEVIVVEAEPLELLTDDVTSPCPGTTVTLNATPQGGFPNYTIVWNPGGQGESIDVNPTTDASYEVTVLDACGGTVSEVVNVIVLNPGTEITADGGYACLYGVGQIINLDGGTGNYTFTYPTDTLDLYLGQTSDNWDFVGYYPGVYTIYIEDDCMASGYVEVAVEICNLIIPNVFTPNNDGSNDGWVIEGIEAYPGSKVKIYDRWGKLMHESERYHQEVWRPAEGEVSEGTYYYIVEILHNDGSWENFEGHITLLTK